MRDVRNLEGAWRYVFPPIQGMYTPADPSRWGTRYQPMQGMYLPKLWLPFRDKGDGEVDVVNYGFGGVSMTFARATVAWCQLSNGFWKQVASGVPRSHYLTSGRYVGYLSEGAGTNGTRHSRDFTNVLWVKTDLTAAKDATGIDNVASSCSTLTATAANGTALQAIVSGAVNRTFSIFIKRKTGTGTISLTLDGGATWTDVTAQINALTFTRVKVTQNLANPSFGVKISTMGDEIYVDIAQEEQTGYMTSPIPSTASAGVRNADTLSCPLTGWYNALEGGLVVEYTPLIDFTGAGRVLATVNDGTANERIQIGIASTALTAAMFVTDGGVTQASPTAGPAIAVESRAKMAGYYKLNDVGIVLNAGTISADLTATMPTPNIFRVGGLTATTNPSLDGISEIKYFDQRLPDSVWQYLTHLGVPI